MARREAHLQECISAIQKLTPIPVITDPVAIFQDRLTTFQLRSHSVTEDQKVGYRALAFALFQDEAAYDLIQELVYSQISLKRRFYKPLIRPGTSFDFYCLMLNLYSPSHFWDHTWMHAISDLFNVTIRILWEHNRCVYTEISPRVGFSSTVVWLGGSADSRRLQPLLPLNSTAQPYIRQCVKSLRLIVFSKELPFNTVSELCHILFDHLQKVPAPNNMFSRHAYRIGKFGLKKIHIDGEGNCLFRTLSFLLSNTDDYHDLVRKMAVSQMRSNQRRYEPLCLLCKRPEYTEDETFEQYLSRMANLGTWGDDGCIQAIADLCGIKITDIGSGKAVLIEYVPQGHYYKEALICRNTHHMQPLLSKPEIRAQENCAKRRPRCDLRVSLTRCDSRRFLNEVSDKAVSSQRQVKTPINIVVIGPEESGKSTTTGHLIYKLGGVAKSFIDDLENFCSSANKPLSLKYAWVLDKLKEEREHGYTINISLSKFETQRFFCTVIDAPGRRRYIKNLITGISQADSAVLVVDSSKDDFGVALEHALLAFTFGIRQITCCCNKMDELLPKYSEARFNKIKTELVSQLKDVGYKPDDIFFVPISGFLGENLTDRSSDKDLDWYKGPTLIEFIDSLNIPRRPAGMPLRLPICGVSNIPGSGTVPFGFVVSGVLKPGMEVTFGPTGLTAEVQSLKMHGNTLVEAMPGDMVNITLQNVSENVIGEVIKRGYVASSSMEDPAKGANSFVAEVVIINPCGKIKNGYRAVIHCHTSYMHAEFTLLSKVDRRTGKELETTPMSLIEGDRAYVKLTLEKPIVVEPFMEFPSMGGFAVIDRYQIVAVGVIKSVDKKRIIR